MSTTVKRLRDDLRWALRRGCDPSTDPSGKTLTISSDDPRDLSAPATVGESSSFTSGLSLTISSPRIWSPPPTDAEVAGVTAPLSRDGAGTREQLAERALESLETTCCA
jgi:hypothetical protein